MYRKYLPKGISSTAPRHKEKPGSATASEKNSLPRALPRVDKATNTKKSKREPSELAELRRIQKMSVEELKEVILSAGYELPDCTCTWPDDHDPEGEFMERMEKSIKDRARRERHDQRKKGEQSKQKGCQHDGH